MKIHKSNLMSLTFTIFLFVLFFDFFWKFIGNLLLSTNKISSNVFNIISAVIFISLSISIFIYFIFKIIKIIKKQYKITFTSGFLNLVLYTLFLDFLINFIITTLKITNSNIFNQDGVYGVNLIIALILFIEFTFLIFFLIRDFFINPISKNWSNISLVCLLFVIVFELIYKLVTNGIGLTNTIQIEPKTKYLINMVYGLFLTIILFWHNIYVVKNLNTQIKEVNNI